MNMNTTIGSLRGYVQNVIDGNVYIRVFDRGLKGKIKSMGGKRAWLGRILEFDMYLWRLPYQDDHELSNIFKELREIKIPFSVGKGWGPAEVFEKLREDNFIEGKYKRLNWTGEGKNEVNIEEV